MALVKALSPTSVQQKLAGRTYYMRLEECADFSKPAICYQIAQQPFLTKRYSNIFLLFAIMNTDLSIEHPLSLNNI
jgi:hypothetical protein